MNKFPSLNTLSHTRIPQAETRMGKALRTGLHTAEDEMPSHNNSRSGREGDITQQLFEICLQLGTDTHSMMGCWSAVDMLPDSWKLTLWFLNHMTCCPLVGTFAACHIFHDFGKWSEKPLVLQDMHAECGMHPPRGGVLPKLY